MDPRPKLVDLDWLNTNFPCMMACPIHTDAGRYVALIAEGRFDEAYGYARGPNPLAASCGRVCSHPCETACRRGQIDRPVAIRALKRFLSDRHAMTPRSGPLTSISHLSPPKNPSPKIAIVGGGPVGLSAAHDLALMGYSITIFEASPIAGGMLSNGVPQYRLPRQIIDAEVSEILSTGDITLHVNQAAGRDFSVAGLRDRGFDAVLIAVGAQQGNALSIPGVELDGVHTGIEFLRSVNAGSQVSIGRRVVVIGGGDVAMDVARTTLREVLRHRCLAPEVHIVCLEQRHEMPASLEEITAAEDEGVILHPGFGPKQILGRDGKVIGLTTSKTKWVFDAQGRFNPAFHEGSESQLACDTVIIAIGQSTQLDFLRPNDGVETSPRGLIVVNPENLMTTAPGVFAGGDCVFGPRLLIDAIGDGKRAAVSINEYLSGRRHDDPMIEIEILKRHEMPANFMVIPRQPIPELPIEQRTGNAEVEISFDEATARAEASRCLRCWINTVFEGNEADGSRCTLCGGCVDICPENCLQLVALDRIEFDTGTIETLQDNAQLFGVELDDVVTDELGVIAGSVMIKDETRCIRCGLCGQRCPVATITMEAYHVVTVGSAQLVPVQAMDVATRPAAWGSGK